MGTELERLKLSLRLDGDEDDALLMLYMDAAETYVRSAIADPDEYVPFFEMERVKALMETAIIAQATGYYTARTALSNVPLRPINLSVNSIIGQLRGRFETYLLEVEDED